jgi:hypothetical protein
MLPDITRQMSDFTQVLAEYGYWMLPELTEYIRTQQELQPKLQVK